MAWTTDDLLSAVRRSGFLPDAHDLSSSDLLSFADEEAATLLADIWKTSREEHRVAREDIALVASTARYRLPRRALARGVRGITYVSASGVESPVQEVPPLEAWRMQSTSTGYLASLFYYFEDDEIVLASAPTSSGGYLRVRYYKRAPRMIVLASAARITEASSSTVLVLNTTGGAPPSTIQGTEGAGDCLVDIIRGDSPFPAIYEDLLVASFSDPNLTLDASTPVDTDEISDSTVAGTRRDYVVPRDCTVYPPLPQEMHPVLVSAVIRRAMEALRDREGAELAEATLRRRTAAAVNVLEPRNHDRKPALIARSGALRGRSGLRGRWGR